MVLTCSCDERAGVDWGQSMITVGFYGDERSSYVAVTGTLLPDCQVVDLFSDMPVRSALVWAPPPNAFNSLPNLKGIALQGGVSII